MIPPSNYHSGYLAPTNTKDVDDWEEWEDDDVVTPIDAGEQVQICQPPNIPTSTQNRNTKSATLRASRISTAKVRRIKSRQRQKAQNAKAGIRLITDMSVFRRNNHVAHYMRSPTGRTGKFVDAAALRALEGEPSSASVGNWNWLKRSHGKTPDSATPARGDRGKNQELSPEDRPIVIGISLPSSDMEGREISPQTALINDLETPFPPTQSDNSRHQTGIATGTRPQKSVWSPDTPDTSCSFESNGAASSVYSQLTMPRQLPKEQTPPPVPELPPGYKKTAKEKALSLDLSKNQPDDDDSGTPCTLFEEDGASSPQRQPKPRGLGISPDSAGSRSHGWWDHVVTPFVDKRMSFSSRKLKTESPKSPKSPKIYKEQSGNSPWTSHDIKEKPQAAPSPKVAPAPVKAPIVRAPTPRRTPPPRSDTRTPEMSQPKLIQPPISAPGPSTRQMPQIVITRDSTSTSDNPPPYSPPKKKQEAKSIRYRAVFPPGHPLHSQFPPSPRPASPGLAATMTSQRGRQLETVDRTPALIRTQTPPLISEPLPVRAMGTFVPQEHAYSAAGNRHKIERQRRRHEKEDIIARRAGGFWRGRGCMPTGGCFGRTGREGRKRRRVWMAIWGGIISLIILIIVLAVLLTRRHSPEEIPSIWVNLTDFPPMPTGVLTVVGPDNIAAKSVCTAPSTLWSCSLPKDQQASVAPYKPNQPTLIMQIQWDNGTRRSWNVPNGDPPTAISTVTRRAFGAATYALSVLKRAPVPTEFTPNPAPPKFKEVWFLGETTDNVKSDQKGGEPAPFYISLLKSTNDTVATPSLTRRGISPNIGNTTFKDLIPPPDVEKDGTSAPAVMMPNPVQQPIRLFDRGLPTEHYGFYTYFKRTIFLKSVNIQNKTDSNIPLDEDGGCRKTEASHLVTWGETRLHVQIWTRALSSNTSSLLKPDGSKGIGGTGELVRPGTMPYPVTVTQDTHGGDPDKKLVWDRPIDDRLQVATTEAQAFVNDMGVGGTWINKRATGEAKFGGFDGGSGGCKCEWVNWV
ncbi:glycoprotease family protein [Pochonia chlamydosporia 170]|uniref:Glycoprotease family protein n=1 Tax=Pochonia chlamydosporia 170 TaxID=1380566 RepID=A0A179FXZ5_METCM|nr:glycoprotease family protein [Pochonia chlamydosporia 170]OAQ70502.1 glycoprotease family protein [Pochonia chlamydosporia 170]